LQSTRHVRKEERMTVAKDETCQEREQDNNCKVRHARKEIRITIAKYKPCQERGQDDNCKVQDMP